MRRLIVTADDFGAAVEVNEAVERAHQNGILSAASLMVAGAAAGDAVTRAKAMPDAILLDWNMPVMSGIDFLRQLRKMDGGQTPIVVFCTTENDIQHIQEAITAGANEYIMKPFDSEIIESKFSQVGLL